MTLCGDWLPAFIKVSKETFSHKRDNPLVYWYPTGSPAAFSANVRSLLHADSVLRPLYRWLVNSHEPKQSLSTQ